MGIKLPEVVATTITPLTPPRSRRSPTRSTRGAGRWCYAATAAVFVLSEALGLTEPNVNWFAGEVAIPSSSASVGPIRWSR